MAMLIICPRRRMVDTVPDARTVMGFIHRTHDGIHIGGRKQSKTKPEKKEDENDTIKGSSRTDKRKQKQAQGGNRHARRGQPQRFHPIGKAPHSRETEKPVRLAEK